MAGNRNSPSRLGVTLQGYHQVIALSQGNINESLEYHFTAKPELCKFEVQLKTSGKESLKGTILPPTIELIDIENADQALYVLQFAKGTFAYWDFSGDEPEKTSIDARGWRLAFYVDFSLKKMGTMPEHIRNAIDNPGLYSVDQLLIDFGTAEIVDFNWAKSRIAGFQNTDDEDTAKDTITLFVAKWLGQLKAADDAGSHNVLAYAVKVDAEKAEIPLAEAVKKANPKAPSFPPTSVRLQTINYRPDGDASKAQSDHDYNAFLFTEMTGTTPMIGTDLVWSGDIFYESIGGTLIMSRHIFWEQFLKPKLKEVCEQNQEAALQGAEGAARALADQLKHNNLSTAAIRGYWFDEGYGCSKQNKYQYNSADFWNPTGKPATMSFSVKDTIQPRIGEGVVDLTREFHIDIQRGPETEGCRITGMTWHERVALKAVADTGVLTAEYISWEGSKLPADRTQWNDQHRFVDSMREYKYSIDIKSVVEGALNGQGHFIFPGGGDFQMKDPVCYSFTIAFPMPSPFQLIERSLVTDFLAPLDLQ